MPPVILEVEEAHAQQAQALALACIDLCVLLAGRWQGWKASSLEAVSSLPLPAWPQPVAASPQTDTAATADGWAAAHLAGQLAAGLTAPLLWAAQAAAEAASPLCSQAQLAGHAAGYVQHSLAVQLSSLAAPLQWAAAATAEVSSPLRTAVGLGGAATALAAAAAAGDGGPLRWLAGYAAAELGFQGYQRWRFAQCDAERPLPDVSEAATVMERCCQLAGIINVRDFLSGWFCGAPFEAIRRDNVRDFVGYCFFYRPHEQLSPQQQAATIGFVRRAELACNVRFPPGSNPDIAPMRHLWEPLRVLPKPLAVHAASEAAGLLIRAVLRCQGFRESVSDGFPVWVRPPLAAAAQDEGGDSASSPAACGGGGGSSRPAARPLVFLHGVGFGLLPYLPFLHMLAAAVPHHPVVLAEARHISLRLCGEAPTVDDMALAVAAVLRRHGFERACFVGHSYGTFVVSRLRQLHPQMVASMALLDPVCLMTCSPHLVRNFIYRPPRWDPSWAGLLDAARWVTARDLMVAATFCRRFYWHQLMLWPQQMPAGATLIVLSARDDLVPISLVQAQLKAAASDARVLVHPTAPHGCFIFDRPFQERIVAEVQQLLVATGEGL